MEDIQLTKLQNHELSTAIALATQELDLEHMSIKFEIKEHIHIDGRWGDTCGFHGHYRIRLATHGNDQLVRTIGHELYHVWQLENDVPVDCDTADKFGFDLVNEIKWQMSVAR